MSIASTQPPVRPRPAPAYDNAEVRALSEQLEDARARTQRLRAAGQRTEEVEQEIIQLRRRLREGGQLRAGDSLSDGRYLLITSIGRGGFAMVWEAHDCAEQRPVAIKVLHHHLATDRQRRERFFRGARIMSELTHPAVVRVLDPHGEDEHFCYFVMELMPGGNLRDAVLGKRIEPPRALPLIFQVGEALAAAHRRGLVHRDVKPANILLDEHGNAKLTDFDLVGAADTTGGTRTGALGTVVYAAPECLDKPQEATARADVFGLGMTAIFCLYGRDLSMATFRHPQTTIRQLDCSLMVRAALNRAVDWDANNRFENAAVLLHALRNSLNDRDSNADAAASQQDGSRVDTIIAALRFVAGKYAGGEFPLRTNRRLTIGRSSEASIMLVEDMVSRRHAIISSTSNSIYIEDFDSTNGTFVNGEKIFGPTRLQTHDRILIGTSIIKVFPVEGQLATDSEAEARRRLEVGAEERQATQDQPMSGVIEEVPLPDLLRLLSTSRKTGALAVSNGGSTGKMYLRHGDLYFATIDDDPSASPQGTMWRMLSWSTGMFEFQGGVEVAVTDELREPLDVLLNKGLRQHEAIRTPPQR